MLPVENWPQGGSNSLCLLLFRPNLLFCSLSLKRLATSCVFSALFSIDSEPNRVTCNYLIIFGLCEVSGTTFSLCVKNYLCSLFVFLSLISVDYCLRLEYSSFIFQTSSDPSLTIKESHVYLESQVVHPYPGPALTLPWVHSHFFSRPIFREWNHTRFHPQQSHEKCHALIKFQYFSSLPHIRPEISLKQKQWDCVRLFFSCKTSLIQASLIAMTLSPHKHVLATNNITEFRCAFFLLLIQEKVIASMNNRLRRLVKCCVTRRQKNRRRYRSVRTTHTNIFR